MKEKRILLFTMAVFSGTPWLAAQTNPFVIVGTVLVAYQRPCGAVTAPDIVRVITQLAFYKMEDISEVTIPAMVEGIDFMAYRGGYVGANEGEQVRPVLIVHGALSSADQAYTRQRAPPTSYCFVPFGQEDDSLINFIVTRYYTDEHFPDSESTAIIWKIPFSKHPSKV